MGETWQRQSISLIDLSRLLETGAVAQTGGRSEHSASPNSIQIARAILGG